jgi:peptidoglycan/xylan/chitin deacetylase (PgdA/CDA1 family)
MSLNGRFRVALTFDAEHADRPNAKRTSESVLATLAKRETPATFFIQGRWAQALPEAVRAIVAGGHQVGHHSHYHARMPLLTDAGIAADIADGARAVINAGGPDPRPWFRCPFGAGAADERVLGALSTAGYRHVGWHVSSDDWEPNRSAQLIATEVTAAVLAHGDGAVVLFHSWPASTPRAVGSVVTRLLDAGAEFCRVDELAEVPSGVPG